MTQEEKEVAWERINDQRRDDRMTEQTGDKMKTKKKLSYKIVRTYSAGVFAGYLESRKGREVVLRQARRLWKWAGAATLSQLAVDGPQLPDDCKFPCEVDRVELLEVIEILDVTENARLKIAEVKAWAL